MLDFLELFQNFQFPNSFGLSVNYPSGLYVFTLMWPQLQRQKKGACDGVERLSRPVGNPYSLIISVWFFVFRVWNGEKYSSINFKDVVYSFYGKIFF